MPRYLVERTFPGRLSIPANRSGADALQKVIAINSEEGVTWLQSFVNMEKTKTFDIYDGPDARAIERVAKRNDLPVERITQVSVLDPYFYL